MKFKFSLKVTLICAILICAMLRASYWQFQRHHQKEQLIETLYTRLLLPVADLAPLAEDPKTDWTQFAHRRLAIKGEYDYAREVVIKNRRSGDIPGMYVLTPLKIAGAGKYIIVNRGFIPIGHTAPEKRRSFQKGKTAEFTGLVKETMHPKFYSPDDAAAGPGKPWVDEWLRVDLEHMQRQLPYPILPVYVETIPPDQINIDPKKIIRSDSQKEDMLLMPLRINTLEEKSLDLSKYPLPVFDAVIPPGRHAGYVYEWAFMAFMTFLIALVLQLRRH